MMADKPGRQPSGDMGDLTRKDRPHGDAGTMSFPKRLGPWTQFEFLSPSAR